jgi:hypothetical protein
MTGQTMFKIGQVAGAVLLIVGVASCQLGNKTDMHLWFMAGAALYGGCRLAAWFARKE